MNYSDIKTGDLIFFRGSGFLSYLIRKWSKSSFAHVGIAWCMGGRILILETRPAHKGVTIDRTLSNAISDVPTWLKSPIVWNEECEIRALSNLGIKYGWFSALRAAFGYSPDSTNFDCSEYVAYVLGINVTKGLTPDELFNSIKENKCT